jgi:hypothetical protein
MRLASAVSLPGMVISIIGRPGQLCSPFDNSHFTRGTAPDAHRRLESGKAQGKIVIDIDEGGGGTR